MKKFLAVLKEKNIGAGYLYFYIHFITEVVCFYLLYKIHGNSYLLWIIPLVYDADGFWFWVKINLGLIGVVFLTISMPIYFLFHTPYLAIVILCIGNALLHVEGAETTLRSSNGKLASPAIFVGGGSFGVVTGRLLAGTRVTYLLLVSKG